MWSDNETSIALLAAFHTQKQIAPEAKPVELARLRQETREQIAREASAWAQLMIDSGIGRLKDGWDFNSQSKQVSK